MKNKKGALILTKRGAFALFLIFCLCLPLVGCTSSDPIPDNIYAQSIYPASTGSYSIGSAPTPWPAGYFTDIYVSTNTSIHTADNSSIGVSVVTPITTATTTNGTGFLKGNGATIIFDNSTYLTGNENITLSGDVSGSGTTSIPATVTGVQGKPVTLNTGYLNYNGSSWVSDNTPALSQVGNADFLPVLLQRGNYREIPTNVAWSETKTGTGSGGYFASYQRLRAGTGAGTDMLSAGYLNISTGTWEQIINWDRQTYFIFDYALLSSGTSTHHTYVSLCDPAINGGPVLGSIGNKGIGIRTDGNALYGESFGTSLDTVDLGVTLNSWWGGNIGVAIVLTPGVSVTWYVDIGDGTGMILRGTQTTTAKIPSGTSATYYTTIVHGLNNPGTDSVTTDSQLYTPVIVWQAR